MTCAAADWAVATNAAQTAHRLKGPIFARMVHLFTGNADVAKWAIVQKL